MRHDAQFHDVAQVSVIVYVSYITCPIVILTVTEGNSDIYQDGKIKRTGTKISKQDN